MKRLVLLLLSCALFFLGPYALQPKKDQVADAPAAKDRPYFRGERFRPRDPADRFNADLGVFDPQTAAISDDGKRVVVGYRNWGTGANPNVFAKLWNAETGEIIRKLDGHDDSVFFVAFLAGRNDILTAGGDGRINFYTGRTGELQKTIHTYEFAMGHFGQGWGGFAMSPDGHVALTQGTDEYTGFPLLRLWDLRSRKMLWSQLISKIYCNIAISPDKKYGLFGDDGLTEHGVSFLLDLETAKIVHEFPEKDGWCGQFHFSADSKYAILGKIEDNLVRVAWWDIAQRREPVGFPQPRYLAITQRHTFLPTFIALDRNRLMVARAENEKLSPTLQCAEFLVFHTWEIQTGLMEKSKPFSPLRGAKPTQGHIAIDAWALSRDLRKVFLAAAGGGPTLMQVWDFQTGARLVNWEDSSKPSE